MSLLMYKWWIMRSYTDNLGFKVKEYRNYFDDRWIIIEP